MNDQLAYEMLAELKAISEHLQKLVELQTSARIAPEVVFKQSIASRGAPSHLIFAHANPPNPYLEPQSTDKPVPQPPTAPDVPGYIELSQI